MDNNTRLGLHGVLADQEGLQRTLLPGTNASPTTQLGLQNMQLGLQNTQLGLQATQLGLQSVSLQNTQLGLQNTQLGLQSPGLQNTQLGLPNTQPTLQNTQLGLHAPSPGLQQNTQPGLQNTQFGVQQNPSSQFEPKPRSVENTQFQSTQPCAHPASQPTSKSTQLLSGATPVPQVSASEFRTRELHEVYLENLKQNPSYQSSSGSISGVPTTPTVPVVPSQPEPKAVPTKAAGAFSGFFKSMQNTIFGSDALLPEKNDPIQGTQLLAGKDGIQQTRLPGGQDGIQQTQFSDPIQQSQLPPAGGQRFEATSRLETLGNTMLPGERGRGSSSIQNTLLPDGRDSSNIQNTLLPGGRDAGNMQTNLLRGGRDSGGIQNTLLPSGNQQGYNYMSSQGQQNTMLGGNPQQTIEATNMNVGNSSSSTAFPQAAGPLQLIRIEETGRCVVQEPALRVLEGLGSSKVAIICVTGLYRTGKSFLLNRLLGLQDGFEIGPSVNPCTKGLWIWGQPVQLAKDYHCILLDTEGLGSAQRTTSVDMQIFGLSILLSSFFIYNSMGPIDEEALDNLSLVLNLSKHIHVRTQQTSETIEGLGKGDPDSRALDALSAYFPSFTWVCRDFNLDLSDEEGKEISPNDYLESALKLQNSRQSQNESESKNQIRDVIRSLFRDRACHTLVRPVADETQLQAIQKLPYEGLRPKFRQQIETLVQFVYSNIKPKQIGGSSCTGAIFSKLCQEYCNTMNTSGMPTIHTAWTSVVNAQLRQQLKIAVQQYRSVLNAEAMAFLPIPDEKFRYIHETAKKEAIATFQAPFVGIGNADVERVDQYRAELKSRILQLYEHADSENKAASRRKLERKLKEANSDVASRIRNGECVNVTQFREDIKLNYIDKLISPAANIGPAVAERTPQIIESILDHVSNLISLQVLAGKENQIRKLERELQDQENKNASVQQRLDAEAGAEKRNASEMHAKFTKEKVDLEYRIDQLEKEKEQATLKHTREVSILQNQERSLSEQLKILRERMVSEQRNFAAGAGQQVAGGKTAVNAAEMESLKDAVYACMTELKNSDFDKRQLETKADYERHMIGLERKFHRNISEAKKKSQTEMDQIRAFYEGMVEVQQAKDLAQKNENLALKSSLKEAQLELASLKERYNDMEQEKRRFAKLQDELESQAKMVTAFLAGNLGSLGGGVANAGGQNTNVDFLRKPGLKPPDGLSTGPLNSTPTVNGRAYHSVGNPFEK